MAVDDEAAEEIHKEVCHPAMAKWSIWERCLSGSIIDSITTRLRSNNLSTKGRSRFFIRRLIGVKNQTPKISRRSSVNACER